ncbi:EAL domain-containing protein [Paraburkholderia lycopersici]|uniref:EAL domain, c-di-GMP-specific phosphodiesterase class I (Or its enzymatically inactive variant) n=1 Tax=Paraburkholderia lycopersici TaxID=416944 RepID=A0A1G6QX59_9BURK|nr:EAL domain-containing protein [Paraburkholderia lycopersici]SDC96861.1 EAL domain, c-di-GMP-specific phosphodiesterase class I (or its enzymatically inactive variant) [Paraburkholderia lycopersici]
MNELHAPNNHAPAISREPDHATDTGFSDLYGPRARSLIGAVHNVLEQRIPDVIALFYSRLGRLDVARRLLDMLPESELNRLHMQQIENLKLLASPELTYEAHYDRAIRVGRTHAIVGLSRQELVRSRGVLFGALQDCIDGSICREALSVLSRRLNRDLACQLEAYEELQEARQRVVLEVTQLAWAAQSYSELIRRLVGILGSLEEVAACAIGRPDHMGILRFEAVSGERMARYLAAGEQSNYSISIREDVTGQGPAGRGWRSGKPERVLNFQTDPCAAIWRDAARREGFRSSVSIPIRDPGHDPLAILSLYSPFPGGYSGAGQCLFVDLLQTVLGFAIARIQAAEGAARTVPFGIRQRWIALMRSDGLEMYYQPIMDLASGSINKVEVLARLRDGDRLVTPGEFLGVLSADDYFTLYVRGLKQALGQRNRWLQAGFDIGLSVNLPTEALQDKRYFQATQDALEEFSCAARHLTLEVLETERVPTGAGTRDEFGKFKDMGVLLAEDDLGSGHSSLARLNELPFDFVKIDRSIVGFANRGALDPLRFVYQLTRLGHSLGMSVVAEGVEDAALLPALQILGADAVQGYAISRPMPAANFTTWMQARSGTPATECLSNSYVKLAKLILWEERLALQVRDPASIQWLRNADANPDSASLPVDEHDGSARAGTLADAQEPLGHRPFEAQWQRDLARLALRCGMQSPDYRTARDRIAAEFA